VGYQIDVFKHHNCYYTLYHYLNLISVVREVNLDKSKKWKNITLEVSLSLTILNRIILLLQTIHLTTMNLIWSHKILWIMIWLVLGLVLMMLYMIVCFARQVHMINGSVMVYGSSKVLENIWGRLTHVRWADFLTRVFLN
jgi:hypothetical protein